MSAPVYKVGDPAPPPLPRRSEAEVIARWQGDKPVVSIRCATYQHVDFIEDALRGFLGQDTDFPFEILVRDDASTDGTAEIVRDYAERYPNIIRAVLETENRYPEVKAGQVLGPMARGEFIAVCEGDDYWVDPDHLARGVNLLRSNQNLAVVAGLTAHIQDGAVARVRPRCGCRGRLPGFVLAAFCNLQVHTSAKIYWARLAPLVRGGHSTSNSLLGAHGAAMVSQGIVSVRRIHSGGIFSGRPIEEQMSAAHRSSLRLFNLHRNDGRALITGALAVRLVFSWIGLRLRRLRMRRQHQDTHSLNAR